jgi:hypothetical protein
MVDFISDTSDIEDKLKAAFNAADELKGEADSQTLSCDELVPYNNLTDFVRSIDGEMTAKWYDAKLAELRAWLNAEIARKPTQPYMGQRTLKKIKELGLISAEGE